jgi:NAD-dependent deacetylase
MEQLDEKVQKVAALLKNSSYAVIITGSGLSDKGDEVNFRSPGSGMWTMLDPDEFTIQRFKENPNAFYEIGAPFFSMLEDKPGEAHKAIAELEKKGLVKAIITKNIDGYHQEAGSKNVLEIYGTLRSASCTGCEYKVETKDIIDEVEKGNLPKCPDCGQPLKPDVTLFGEPLSEDFHKAKHEIEKSDLVLVIGTAIITSPSKELLANSNNLVIINRDSTTQDYRAKEIINTSPDKVLQLLLEALNKDESA